MIYKNFIEIKNFITGHTGFKGSWFTFCLLVFGAKILGISKNDEKLIHYKKNCYHKDYKCLY